MNLNHFMHQTRNLDSLERSSYIIQTNKCKYLHCVQWSRKTFRDHTNAVCVWCINWYGIGAFQKPHDIILECVYPTIASPVEWVERTQHLPSTTMLSSEHNFSNISDFWDLHVEILQIPCKHTIIESPHIQKPSKW